MRNELIQEYVTDLEERIEELQRQYWEYEGQYQREYEIGQVLDEVKLEHELLQKFRQTLLELDIRMRVCK